MIDNFLEGEGFLTPGNAAVALIILDDGRFLCQLRSQKPGIFYPDHWGLFGGAADPDESPEDCLRRELEEELALVYEKAEYFTEFIFDFSFRGFGKVWRRYYVILLNNNKLKSLRLGEGREFKAFTANELLTQKRVVPYDAFAIWLYKTQRIVN